MSRYNETKDGFWTRTPDPNGVKQCNINGRRESTGCRDLGAARLWRAEREKEAADPAYAAAQAATVATTCEQFVAHLEVAGRSEATLSFYEGKFGHLVRYFDDGEAKLTAISLEKMEAYVTLRLSEGASRSTVKKELTATKSMLSWARHAKKFHLHPTDVMPYKFGAKSAIKELFVPKEELPTLLRNLPRHRAAWVALAIGTGGRFSEVQRIKREHIDLVRGTVFLDGRKTEGARRTIPILTFAFPLLTLALQDGDGEGDLVVSNWATGNMKRDIQKACGTAYSANDLRRTFATWLVSAGVSTSVVAYLMGHKTSAMVERHYGRLQPATAGELVARILEENEKRACTEFVPSTQDKADFPALPGSKNQGKT